MQFSESERHALMNLLQWRRDVRHFRTDPIPDNLLHVLRQALDWAPSVGNSRPWRVFQVDSPAKRQGVHDIFVRANKEALHTQAKERQGQYRQLKLEGLKTAPLQLAIFTDSDPAAGHRLGRQTMPQTLEHSTAMAVQNLSLAARAHGLGVGMVSILDPQAMACLFAVPSTWHLSFYLCIGWPQSHDDTPLLHRNGWQHNCPTQWQTC